MKAKTLTVNLAKEDLEDRLNDWLNNNTGIEIKHVSTALSTVGKGEAYLLAILFYEEPGGTLLNEKENS